MEILEAIDYLAQRGELTLTCSEVAFASDGLCLQINLPAWDRRSYLQAIQECVFQAQKVPNEKLRGAEPAGEASLSNAVFGSGKD